LANEQFLRLAPLFRGELATEHPLAGQDVILCALLQGLDVGLLHLLGRAEALGLEALLGLDALRLEPALVAEGLLGEPALLPVGLVRRVALVDLRGRLRADRDGDLEGLALRGTGRHGRIEEAAPVGGLEPCGVRLLHQRRVFRDDGGDLLGDIGVPIGVRGGRARVHRLQAGREKVFQGGASSACRRRRSSLRSHPARRTCHRRS
jgi:hypothetical protein